MVAEGVASSVETGATKRVHGEDGGGEGGSSIGRGGVSTNATNATNRRRALVDGTAVMMAGWMFGMVGATAAPPGAAAAAPQQQQQEEGEAPKVLCDDACAAELARTERVTTASGLAFQDIKVGQGPAPPVGYQVVVHYIAMTPEGRVISNSLESGTPYDIRVGAGMVVAGLDEGLKTMRVGGIRRVYVPGNLAFPKGLPAGPGRPRVPPSSPVVFDVQLLYIPGLDMEDE